MKALKEKKGFTLIELLAVIVVLAIVMVLATTTVLPYMTNARKESFALEANAAKEAASNAVSLIMIGKLKDNYTETKDASGNVTGYCFTIDNLKTAGLFEKDDADYAGVVKVTKSTNAYSYLVEFENDEFFVKQTTSGDVSADDLSDRTEAENDVTVACS